MIFFFKIRHFFNEIQKISLSRHKRECPVYLKRKSTEMSMEHAESNDVPSYDINGIDDSEIVDVQEHNMVIKVVTKNDGTVLFVYVNFKFCDPIFSLQPLQKIDENHIHKPNLYLLDATVNYLLAIY